LKTQGREIVGVCSEQRTERGGREVMCMDCGFVVGDKKSKESRGRPGKEGKAED
jgi:hypothetical protein